MRVSSIIVVVTALFVGVGAALGISLLNGDANNLDGFEDIYYVRDVEHRKLSLFGNCPLGREIVVGRTGKVRINWYVQQPDHHGCRRAADFGSNESIEKQSEEPVIARTTVTLSKSNLRELLTKMNALRWEADWQEPEDMSFSFTSGCERRTNSFSDRVLAVTRPGPKVANLWVYGEDVSEFGDAECTANEIANAATLDAAVASFAPLLPTQYHLSPAVAGRLYREP